MTIPKTRVLYLLRGYPALSETYIKAEIDALRTSCEFLLVSTEHALVPYSDHLPYHVTTDLGKLLDLAREFRPDVIHAHWLQQGPFAAEVSELLDVPFTIRSHSHDMQWGGTRGWLFDHFPRPFKQSMPEHLRDARRVLGGSSCLGILCFPFARPRLRKAGIPDNKLHDCFPVVAVGRFFDRSPNGESIMGIGTARVNKHFDDFFDVAARFPSRPFHLYATAGPESNRLTGLAAAAPNVALMQPVQPEEMPLEYKRHRWLLYTASRRLRTVGWPVAIAEAQASGVGVCMPALRPDLREYIGAAGYLYESCAEAAEVLAQPFPDELREAGFELAKRSDVESHIGLLTALWATRD